MSIQTRHYSLVVRYGSGSDLSDEDDGGAPEDEEDWLGSSVSRSSVGGHHEQTLNSTLDESDANIVFEQDVRKIGKSRGKLEK